MTVAVTTYHDEERVPVKKRRVSLEVRFLSSFFSSESIQYSAADIQDWD